MKSWKWTAIILCSYGLFKELQPSEYFITEYLINHKGFTKDVIVHEAYPLSTYTYFGALPFIFIFTDYLKYRPIIFLEAASFVITYALLIWSEGLLALKIIRILHGISGAAEIAYFTYIYAKVDKGHYKKVTSYTHSAVLIGKLIGAITSQLLVSFEIMDFHDLNYISLGGVSTALFLCLFLPSTKESIYFNRRQSIFPIFTVPVESLRQTLRRFSTFEPKTHSTRRSSSTQKSPVSTISSSASSKAKTNGNGNVIGDKNDLYYEGRIVKTDSKNGNDDNDNTSHHIQVVVTNNHKPTLVERFKKAYRYLWKHFTEAYLNLYVFKWSCWWALAMGAHLQIIEYYEALWEDISPEADHKAYNGAVNAIQSALSAIFALLVGIVQIHWFKWGETVLCIISIIQGIAIIWMSLTEYITTAYVLYVVYRTLYQVLITVASAEVAEKISEDSHGLIFGFNTFLAVSIQTILTLSISDHVGLALDIRPEFFIYGCYYVLLGLVFIFVAIYIFCRHGCIKLSWKLPQVELDL